MSGTRSLKQTPFHEEISALVESYEWRRWAGYAVPSKYSLSHEAEYHAIRSAVALLDVSPLHTYAISGPDALRLLNRVTTREVGDCAVGQVQYTLWCDDAGNVLEDGTLSRLGPEQFRLAAAEPNLRWLEDNALGLTVTIEDEAETVGALALQGPLARELLREVAGAEAADLPYYRLIQAEVGGRPLVISRTGYTGDLGYELWVSRADAGPVWQALHSAGRRYGLLPAGMIALDIARIEAGLIMADVDYTPANKALVPAQKSTPYELGLGRLVNLDKPHYFIGREALARHRATPAWHLVGLEIAWESLESAYSRAGLPAQVPHTPWRRSTPLYTPTGREAGYATSGCFSPVLKKYIALATVQPAYAHPGTALQMEITVEHMRRRAAARVVSLPFFNPPRKRRKFTSDGS